MVTEAPALVWYLHSDPRLGESRAGAAQQVGLVATTAPSASAALEWAAGPGAIPDVIVLDDWELDIPAGEFGAGMSQALGERAPPIVYIVPKVLRSVPGMANGSPKREDGFVD